MPKKRLIEFFNKFLNSEARYFFEINTKIISHYPKEIHVYRYEKLLIEIKKILNTLKIKKIRIPLNQIHFKKNSLQKNKKKIIDRNAKKKF